MVRSRLKRTSRRSRGYARQKLINYGRAKRGMAPLARRGFAPFTSGNTEYKVFDWGDMVNENDGDLYTGNVTSTGFVQPFFLPKLGADYNQRNGRKVIVKSFYVKWRSFPAYMETSLVEGQNMLDVNYFPQSAARFLIVWDTQPNGIVPNISDILTQDTTSGYVDVLSFINMDNRDRFKILVDKFHQNGFQNTGTEKDMRSNASNLFTGKKYKKCNLEVIFNATNAGTIADISTGALYFCAIGTEQPNTHNFNVIEVNTRVRYADS